MEQLYKLLAQVWLQHGGNLKNFDGNKVKEQIRIMSIPIIDVEVISNDVVVKDGIDDNKS